MRLPQFAWDRGSHHSKEWTAPPGGAVTLKNTIDHISVMSLLYIPIYLEYQYVTYYEGKDK